MEGRRRRRHPGLRHQRHRGHGRLHRRGQDPLLLAFVLGPPDRPVRHQRQGQGRQDQARSLQFLRRTLLLGRHTLARHLGGGGLEEEGRLGQAQVHPPRRQPSLSAGAQGSGRGAGQAAGLRRRALDPVRARGRRLQGAVPGAAIVGRQLRVLGQHHGRQRRAAALLRHGRRQRAVHGQHLGHGRSRHEGDRQGRRRPRVGGQPESHGARRFQA